MTGKDIIIQLGQMVLPSGRISPDDPGFHLNTPELLQNYQKVYSYMLNERASASVGLTHSKGLLFAGNVGPGKTVCMKVMQQMALRVAGLEHRTMAIVHVNDYLKAYQDKDEDESALFGFGKKMEICIDELGWEASQKHIYGNDPSAIIASWIMERDKLFLETGLRTHYTTNLKIKDAEEPVTLQSLYGARTTDRLKADCNILNWVGGSLRR